MEAKLVVDPAGEGVPDFVPDGSKDKFPLLAAGDMEALALEAAVVLAAIAGVSGTVC
jgi:hypothetical protein